MQVKHWAALTLIFVIVFGIYAIAENPGWACAAIPLVLFWGLGTYYAWTADTESKK